MDIIDYIAARNQTRGMWTRDRCPNGLESIYHLFDDISAVYREGKFPIDSMVLIQSFSGSETSLLQSDQNCVVFDVHQLSMVSQFAEICAFGRIDQESHLSFFHEIWSEEAKSLDMYGDVPSVGLTRLRFKVSIDEEKLKEIAEKFESSTLIAHYSRSPHFYNFFEIVACFIVCHEVAHSLFSGLSKSSVDAFISDLPDLIRTNTNSIYLSSELRAIDFHRLESWQIEEIYCDFHAFFMVEKICIDLNFVPSECLTLAFSFLFGSLIFTSDGSLSNADIEFLRVRSAIIQSFCLLHVEKNCRPQDRSEEEALFDLLLNSGGNVRNFALVQSLQDSYVKSCALELIQANASSLCDSSFPERVKEAMSPLTLDPILREVMTVAGRHPRTSMLHGIYELTQGNEWYMR